MANRQQQDAPPIGVLDREAVREILSEDGGDTTEYCLVAHNRGVDSVALSAWGALPGVRGRGSNTVPKLRSLDLSFNRLAELDVQVLAPLGELRELKLYSNRLTDEVRSQASESPLFVLALALALAETKQSIHPSIHPSNHLYTTIVFIPFLLPPVT